MCEAGRPGRRREQRQRERRKWWGTLHVGRELAEEKLYGGRLRATRRGRGRGQGGVSAMGRRGWESSGTTLLAQGRYHGREGGGDGHWGRQRHVAARVCQHFHLQQQTVPISWRWCGRYLLQAIYLTSCHLPFTATFSKYETLNLFLTQKRKTPFFLQVDIHFKKR